MSQENESCLRFSLEESVWFQKGQEVAELISISLDPNIKIQENDLYVTIKGALQLTGEYKRYEDEEAVEELLSAPKFIQNVEDRGEGVYEFTHRFPVDITIPNNRIQSVYDIGVEVESFDYVFPERSCMKLTADLTISGLYGDQQHAPANEIEEEQVEVQEVTQSFEQEVERPVEVELVAEQQVEEPQEIEFELEPLYRSSAAVAEVEEEVEEVAQQEEVSDVKQEVLEEKEEDLYTPFEAEARKLPESEEVTNTLNKEENWEAPTVTVNEGASSEAVTAVSEVQEVEQKKPVSPEISFSAQRKEESAPVEPKDYKKEESFSSLLSEKEEVESESSSSSSSSEEVVKKKKKPSSKKGLSLTEFFARKEEEELAKLRMCIVQHGDTLDTLAERYDISVQQLLRVNRLEVNQDVYEGQVLYIPIVVAQN
ncbi:stage VI sporulation protein D (plasmid) [Bacillus sp. 31A1R]|uniref:Stage VI sporulation protein D n=1 Tax=Robertmurraya mangrovi TaxID=3098077 RepID=A0ABU5IUF9_9BACI|nr:stage VI sporulation protein D [Bacillus sp. 31A1R]MDZ5470790.1 stage VI sporulation protein D [Bacillus sp. 31A1R]